MGHKSKILPFVFAFIVIDIIVTLNAYYKDTEENFGDKAKQSLVMNNGFKPNAIFKQSSNNNFVYYNSCEEYKKEPSFQRKGRISEQKCSEYVWKRSQFEKCQGSLKRRVFGIIGGYAAMPGDFPHMAAIGWRALHGGWSFKCGASIISPNFLITAAHCTKSKPDPLLLNTVPEIVRLGVVNLERSSTNHPIDINIIEIIKHPKYKSPVKYYDVALLKLQEEVQFGATIQPACLWSKTSTVGLGRKAITSGWGITNVDKRRSSSVLRAVNLFMINSGTCEHLLKPYTNRHWPKLVDHQLCAGEPAGGHDACQGDSGGPLQVQMTHHPKMHYLVGITSFGHGCGLRNVPGLYTRVASFIDWIENNVWKNEIDTLSGNSAIYNSTDGRVANDPY